MWIVLIILVRIVSLLADFAFTSVFFVLLLLVDEEFEISVFLATLELIKVHEVEVEQEENFGDIVLRSVS